MSLCAWYTLSLTLLSRMLCTFWYTGGLTDTRYAAGRQASDCCDSIGG